MWRFACLLIGYGFGNVLFADIVARLRARTSIFELGNGNPGMANTARSLGKNAALACLAGDILKSVAAVLVCCLLFPDEVASLVRGWACVGATLGHDFPVWHGFKGGKGVTTLSSAIVLIDMYTVNKRYLNEERFVSRDDLPEATFEMTPADKQILADTTQNYRVMDVQGFMQPRSSYFHKTVGGYHAAKLTRYNDLIERQIANNNMAVLNMLNARWFMIDASQAQLNPDALGNAWFVDSLTYVKNADAEMKFLDNFNPATSAVADAKFKGVLADAKPKQPGDTIFETTYAPNKLTYHAHSAQGGVAVFSEIYFPWGWKATIDGKEAKLGRVNYVLRAMQLPAGDHTIVMTFDPDEVHQTESVAKTSVYIILLLVLLALGWGIYSSIRKSKGKNQEQTPEI